MKEIKVGMKVKIKKLDYSFTETSIEFYHLKQYIGKIDYVESLHPDSSFSNWVRLKNSLVIPNGKRMYINKKDLELVQEEIPIN